ELEAVRRLVLVQLAVRRRLLVLRLEVRGRRRPDAEVMELRLPADLSPFSFGMSASKVERTAGPRAATTPIAARQKGDKRERENQIRQVVRTADGQHDVGLALYFTL